MGAAYCNRREIEERKNVFNKGEYIIWPWFWIYIYPALKSGDLRVTYEILLSKRFTELSICDNFLSLNYEVLLILNKNKNKNDCETILWRYNEDTSKKFKFQNTLKNYYLDTRNDKDIKIRCIYEEIQTRNTHSELNTLKHINDWTRFNKNFNYGLDKRKWRWNRIEAPVKLHSG